MEGIILLYLIVAAKQGIQEYTDLYTRRLLVNYQLVENTIYITKTTINKIIELKI